MLPAHGSLRQPRRQLHQPRGQLHQPRGQLHQPRPAHHVSYELHLHDGRILRTRISHPVNRDGYGPSLWAHILRDQLAADEGTFWSCVRDGVKPDRGEPEVPRQALPADLVYLLISRMHLSEAEVAAMTKDEAVARVAAYWSTGSPG
jgi:hypothetical protein